MEAVIAHAASSAEPYEGSFFNSLTLEDLEALDLVRALDDLDRPMSCTGDGVAELIARIAAIGLSVTSATPPQLRVRC